MLHPRSTGIATHPHAKVHSYCHAIVLHLRRPWTCLSTSLQVPPVLRLEFPGHLTASSGPSVPGTVRPASIPLTSSVFFEVSAGCISSFRPSVWAYFNSPARSSSRFVQGSQLLLAAWFVSPGFEHLCDFRSNVPRICRPVPRRQPRSADRKTSLLRSL